MLAAQLNELGVSQGPEAPPRPNRQHKSPAPPAQSSNPPTNSSAVQPASNEQNSKQMPQSSSILDQVSDRRRCIDRHGKNKNTIYKLKLHCKVHISPVSQCKSLSVRSTTCRTFKAGNTLGIVKHHQVPSIKSCRRFETFLSPIRFEGSGNLYFF